MWSLRDHCSRFARMRPKSTVRRESIHSPASAGRSGKARLLIDGTPARERTLWDQYSRLPASNDVRISRLSQSFILGRNVGQAQRGVVDSLPGMVPLQPGLIDIKKTGRPTHFRRM